LFVAGLVVLIGRLGEGDMGIAAGPPFVSHDMGTDVDSMDSHHNVREGAFDVLDAEGTPVVVVAIVDVCRDEFLSGESLAATLAEDALGDEVFDALAFSQEKIDA
jgi:hypothetical protein